MTKNRAHYLWMAAVLWLYAMPPCVAYLSLRAELWPRPPEVKKPIENVVIHGPVITPPTPPTPLTPPTPPPANKIGRCIVLLMRTPILMKDESRVRTQLAAIGGKVGKDLIGETTWVLGPTGDASPYTIGTILSDENVFQLDNYGVAFDAAFRQVDAILKKAGAPGASVILIWPSDLNPDDVETPRRKKDARSPYLIWVGAPREVESSWLVDAFGGERIAPMGRPDGLADTVSFIVEHLPKP